MIVKIFLVFSTILLSSALPGRKGELLSLIQVYRHGERSPIVFFPTDPYQDASYWNTGFGQLTNTGKLQHYKLGQYTRSRYRNFIPKYYSNEFFRVQTTNKDRTFMSAASNLAGLFPPVGYQVWKQGLQWQPIPVFPVTEAVLSDYSNCDAYNTAISQLSTTDEYFVSLSEENQELMAYLSEHTGSNITSLSDIVMIWDSLQIEYLRGYTLPEWTQSVFPEPLTSLVSSLYLASSYTEELKIFTTGPFINALIEHFEGILANSTDPPYLQYSGHDINLACILNTLGAYPSAVPGFASTIYFELRQTRRMNYINIYYIKVSGAEPEPITLSGCGFNCDLRDFKSILSNRTITPDEWTELCSA
ncbi:prostatic acid phosphatase-like [Anoplophora glabripennis]|uniref:prostatic acid phosphatase-like n=1 Tax=Anoplophora glabripennis TaxID=217634 RepID=UPI00087415D0|nr:prostatic acid phosphatase-like [Anoplophora glabripennis]